MPEGAFANDHALDGAGGVFVTDSVGGRVCHQDSERGALSVVAESAAWRDGVWGPAGIARLPNGDLMVGVFAAGRLFRIQRPGASLPIWEIALERPLLRPDGIAAFDDRRALVIEGGAGTAQQIDLGTGAMTPAIDGLSGPVNLSILDEAAFITGAGINDPANFNPDDILKHAFETAAFRSRSGKGESP